MRLNAEQLLTYATVVREGGIVAAAHRLHITQPAVSNQLKKLRGAIGMDLYQRSGRGIELTHIGRRLYDHAQRMADSLTDAEEFADALAGAHAGQISIVASQTLGAYLLPTIVAGFRGHAPDIHLDLASYNSREVLERLRGCDVALIEGPPVVDVPEGLLPQPLMQDEIMAVIRRDHPLAASQQLDMVSLSEQPLIWRESGSGTRAQVAQAFIEAGIDPAIDIALAGVAAIKEAVRQGLGIGFMSRLALWHDNAMLTGVSLSPPLYRQLTLIAARHPRAVVLRFIEYLHTEVATLF